MAPRFVRNSFISIINSFSFSKCGICLAFDITFNFEFGISLFASIFIFLNLSSYSPTNNKTGKFKVSISEVDQLENLNYSTVGLVSVSNSSQFLNSLSQNIENFIDQYYPGRIQKTERWIENVD